MPKPCASHSLNRAYEHHHSFAAVLGRFELRRVVGRRPPLLVPLPLLLGAGPVPFPLLLSSAEGPAVLLLILLRRLPALLLPSPAPAAAALETVRLLVVFLPRATGG